MGLFPRPALLVCVAACGRLGFDGGEGDRDGAVGGDGPPPGTVRAAVTISGQGVLQVGGTWCAADCTVDVPAGQPVSTVTVPRDGWQVGTVTCADCDAPVADFSIEAQFTAAPITANRVFLASGNAPVPLGGLGGADAHCMQRATTAGLGGTWIAGLPMTAISVPARLAGSRGWVRMDGRPVIDQPTDVWTRQIYPILLDETGTVRTDTLVAGGATDTGGAAGGRNCTDWSLTTGVVEIRPPTFAGGIYGTTSSTSCGMVRSFACFETGKDVAVAPIVFPYGRRIFVTAGSIDADIGIAAMDAACSSEAATAGLTGTFRALVATSGATAASRFSSLAGPWRRPDGVLVALGDLTTSALETVINRDAAGALSTRGRVWTGAMNLDVAGSAASTCDGWTATTGASGTYVRMFDAGERFYTGTFPCAQSGMGVYCAEDL